MFQPNWVKYLYLLDSFQGISFAWLCCVWEISWAVKICVFLFWNGWPYSILQAESSWASYPWSNNFVDGVFQSITTFWNLFSSSKKHLIKKAYIDINRRIMVDIHLMLTLKVNYDSFIWINPTIRNDMWDNLSIYLI